MKLIPLALIVAMFLTLVTLTGCEVTDATVKDGEITSVVVTDNDIKVTIDKEEETILIE
jgi:predicted component of type VI protein secretion system